MEYVNCNLCDSNDYTVIYKPKEASNSTVKFSLGVLHPNHGQIVRCNKCGLVYVNPRPEVEKLIYKYSQSADLGYSSQRESRIKTFQRKIGLIEKFITKGRLLDIGCALGYFLYIAQKNGWQIEGVEINQNLAKEAERLLNTKIKIATLEDAKFPNNYFDAVTMFDVIEHLLDPRNTLKEVSRIIKPGGILVINFPDGDSIFSKIMKRHWWFLLEDHLYYFSVNLLKEMLNKYGFKILYSKPHWQNLTLAYLTKQLYQFSPTLSKILSYMVKILHLGNFSLRYYAGQTTLVIRREY